MRDDITAIPIMEAGGWAMKFDSRDILYGRTDLLDTLGKNPPNHSVSFEKGNMVVWRAGRETSQGIQMFWRYAELVDGHYTNHRDITIEEASKL